MADSNKGIISFMKIFLIRQEASPFEIKNYSVLKNDFESGFFSAKSPRKGKIDLPSKKQRNGYLIWRGNEK
ncbi:MAG TPA: hypothetical protein VGA67_04535 [Candidatus Dojkabacteria bacterium]